jgi:hypothetical protein
MAKTTHCPFTHSLCAECALYRGRHHYLSFSKQDRGYADEAKRHDSVDFQALKKPAEPWAGRGIQTRNEPRIRLKVIDMETAAARVSELNEAKEWDWNNPEMMRVIDGWQVTSWEGLLEIVCYKAEKGHQEVVLHVAPRFMMLAGG